MLRELSIRNFAIIDDLNIGFSEGLTILSGETGAGKSIIINAVNLLLGSRATSRMVRTGADSAELSAAFDVAAELGGISTAIWGGSTVGDEIVTVPVQINSVEITGDLDTAITFSATLDFAGTPLFGVVTT